MDMRLVLSVLTITVGSVWGFLPNQFSLMSSGTDYTHQDITEIGILQAVAEFFEGRPLAGKTHISPGDLTGIKDITARKLFDKYYGGTVSEKRFQEAIDDIVKANNRVDQDHYTEAVWHVNGETIKDANDKIILLRETTLSVMNKTTPNYDAARELIGQFLHILQMFYSNSNWPELSGQAVLSALGIRGRPLMAQASHVMATCRSCGSHYGIPCAANLMISGPILTSSYKSGQDRVKPRKDPKIFKTGKCSHGGPYDRSATTIAAIGGINKDTSDPKMSPHFALHTTAALGAIKHTREMFADAVTGLRHIVGDQKFQELLQLTPGTSMVFVIDTTGSMGEDITAVKTKVQQIIRETLGTINAPYNYIVVTFNDPGNKTDIFETKNGTKVINYLQHLTVHGGGDCPEFSLTGLQAAATVANPNSKVYVFTDATPKDAAKINYVTSMVTEKKISVDFVLTGDCAGSTTSTSRIVGRSVEELGPTILLQHGIAIDDLHTSSRTTHLIKHSVLRRDRSSGLTLHMDGNPVVGEKILHAIAIPPEILMTEANHLVLLDQSGMEITRAHLKIRGHNYVAETIVPQKVTRLLVEGKDVQGRPVKKELKPIHPSTVSLQVLQVEGDLRTGSSVRITVKVMNKGDNSQQIVLFASDSKGLGVFPSYIEVNLSKDEQKMYSFAVRGGEEAGVSTTVKVLATVHGKPDDVQYFTRILTVHSNL